MIISGIFLQDFCPHFTDGETAAQGGKGSESHSVVGEELRVEPAMRAQVHGLYEYVLLLPIALFVVLIISPLAVSSRFTLLQAVSF